ncbi:MAG: dihydroorotase, partial [Oleibacter sp.]|nr:dihydroorotase [Thalassolituus sp.]
PGLIDLGGFLAEPGYSQKGSIESETRAACKGGFTHVCSLPDTQPIADTSAVVKLILEKSARSGCTKVLPLGALTQKLAGEQLASMVTLIEAGAVALSNARYPIRDSSVMRRLLEYSASFNVPVFLHANDHALAGNGCMHEGAIATRMGLPSIPESAETIALAQILLLVEQTGANIHISQISCARSLEMLRDARARGMNISADTPLANLLYTDHAVSGYHSLFNVQPPLRTEKDRLALIAAVESGELAISSNHRPHELAAKKAPFSDAEAGMSQYDFFFSQAYTLVEQGHLSLMALIAALTRKPAQILGLQHGLQEGNEFHACLFDANVDVVPTPVMLASRGHNHPALGKTLTGLVRQVFVAGKPCL